MSDQWFVHSNDQQLGPYTGEQLVQYAQEGSINAETMVWAEGMAEWAPASQIPGLIPEAPAPTPVQVVAQPVVAQPAAVAWAPPGSRLATGGGAGAVKNPYMAPATALVAPVGGDYPYFPVKAASFGLWLWTFLGGFLCFFIALMVMISGAVRVASAVTSDPAFAEFAEASASGESAEFSEDSGAEGMMETPDPAHTAAMESAAMESASTFGLDGIIFLLGWAAMLVSAILFYIYIYRAWYCLQKGGAQTSPGKAVGFMFIPLFNIYWVFIAINGLPKDWNRIVASYEDLKAAPKLGETTFLLCCIGMFFPPLLVMVFPMMSQLCKGINFFASRRNPNAPATSAFARPTFGGLR